MAEQRPPIAVVLTLSPPLAGVLALAAQHYLPVLRANGASRQVIDELGQARNVLLDLARPETSPSLSGVCRSSPERSKFDDRAGLVDAAAVPIREAARLAGVSESSMRRRIDAGELRAASIGRRRVVLRAELDRFLEEGPCR